MNRAKLVATLEVVGRALERNNILPIYEYFCFTGNTVFSFCDSFGIVAPWDTPTPFAVHGPTFLGLLKATKDDKIDLNLDQHQLKITAGKSEYVLPAKGIEDFIWAEPNFPSKDISLDIIQGIECCLPTASENLALEAFSRIYIGTFEGKLAVYSTDGDALTKYVTTLNGDADVCLDRDFCDAVVKTGGGKLVIGSEWVCSLFEDYKVYGRNLGPSTFNYEDYISKILGGPLPDLIPFPLKFDDALTRARVVADIETSPTTLFIENNQLTLLTDTPFGEVLDTMKVKHADIEAQVSASLMQSNMTGCTNLRVLAKCCIFKGEQVLRLISNL